jgi:hypothetical protein
VKYGGEKVVYRKRRQTDLARGSALANLSSPFEAVHYKNSTLEVPFLNIYLGEGREGGMKGGEKGDTSVSTEREN